MTKPVAMNICPPEETLAAFIDGRLDPEARQRVIEHIVECAECRDIVMTAHEFQADEEDEGTTAPARKVSRFSPRATFIASAVLAAAAVLIVVFGPMVRERWGERGGDMQALVEAAESLRYRPYSGRLSAFDVYRSEKPRTRGATGAEPGQPRLDDLGELRITAIAAELKAQATERPSAKSLHQAGVAQILDGNPSEAAELLERALLSETSAATVAAAISESMNATLLNDLAATYLERKRTPSDIFLAAECAQRAWNLRKTPAIAWNRALALDRLNLKAQAERAWLDYIEADPSSPWSAEAREKLNALRTPSQSEDWSRNLERLNASAYRGDFEASVRMTRLHPQETRIFLEDTLLPRAALDAERSHAEAALIVAKALARVTGDDSMLLSANAVVTARFGMEARSETCVARGYRAYLQARTAYANENITDAAALFQSAVRMLDSCDKAASLRAVRYLGSCLYYTGRYDDARDVLARIQRHRTGPVYSSLAAYAAWISALTYMAQGDPYRAQSTLRAGLEDFEALGETENVMAVHSLLAEAGSYVGEEASSADHRLRALSLLRHLGGSAREHVILTEAAQFSLRSGFPETALQFHDYLVKRATRGDNARELVDALGNRLAVFVRLGDTRSALQDLTHAKRQVERIKDRTLRSLAEHELEIVTARLSPKDYTTAQYAAGVDFWTARNNVFRLAMTHSAFGVARYSVGDRERARRALGLALDAFDATHLGVRKDIGSWSVMPERREIAMALASMALEDRDAESAFMYADRARVSDYDDLALPEDLDRSRRRAYTTLNELQRHLSPSSVMIAYAFVNDGLFAWTVSSRGAAVLVIPADRRSVEILATQLIDPLTGKLNEATATKLHTLLLSPVRATFQEAQELVIVPDRTFNGILWGALRDEKSRRFVVETQDIVVAPTAGLYLRSLLARPERRRDRAVVVGVSTDIKDSDFLPAVARETRAVARLYADSTALLDQQAIGAAVRDLVGDATVIHYSGHGFVNRVFPRFSGIVLNGADKALYVHDVLRWKLKRTPMVFIAACNTGWTSSGAVALADAFLLAGASAVIASSAPALDRGSSSFATTVHYGMTRGNGTVAHALCEAQRQAIRSAAYESWHVYQAYGA